VIYIYNKMQRMFIFIFLFSVCSVVSFITIHLKIQQIINVNKVCKTAKTRFTNVWCTCFYSCHSHV
jgi:hypothetical protein